MQLKQFKHPNIMLLDTYFKDDLETYYLVINYEEAETLQKFVESYDGPIPE